MDKRIYIIASLAILALVITVLENGRRATNDNGFSFSSASKKEINEEQVRAMADMTLEHLGVEKKNIRPVRDSKDVRVLYPATFDVVNFILAMQDSLNDCNATIHSVENVKDNTSVTQIKRGDTVIQSYIFRKEPVSRRKGANHR